MSAQNNRSVLEELKSLCQKITATEEGRSLWKQEYDKKGQLVQGAQRGLRELKISVALVQLDLIASPELTDEVSSLTLEGDTKGLRHLILDNVAGLEQYLSGIDRTKPDIDFIERSFKIISILIELLDSLECSI